VWVASANDLDTKLIWAAASFRVEVTTPDTQTYDPAAHLCYGDIALENIRNPTFLLLVRIK
jgi:hypothetical protein